MVGGRVFACSWPALVIRPAGSLLFRVRRIAHRFALPGEYAIRRTRHMGCRAQENLMLTNHPHSFPFEKLDAWKRAMEARQALRVVLPMLPTGISYERVQADKAAGAVLRNICEAATRRGRSRRTSSRPAKSTSTGPRSTPSWRRCP